MAFDLEKAFSHRMAISEEDFTKYFYTTSLTVTVPNIEEPIELASYIKTFNMYMKFDQHQFPYIELDMMIPTFIMVSLQEHYRDVEFILNMGIMERIGVETTSEPVSLYKNKILRCLEPSNATYGLNKFDSDPSDKEEYKKETGTVSTFTI